MSRPRGNARRGLKGDGILIDEINEAEARAESITEKAKKQVEAMISSAREEKLEDIVSNARDESKKIIERAGRGAEAERLKIISSYRPQQRAPQRAMDRAVSLLAETVSQSMKEV